MVFQDLPRGAAADKVLRDKAFNIAKNPKYDGLQRGLASAFINFDKTTAVGAAKTKFIQNKELAEKLHKTIIRNLKNEKYTHL